MPKLHVCPELLVTVLFPEQIGIKIINAFYEGDNVVLEIEGLSVPDCEEVECIITQKTTIVEFREILPPPPSDWDGKLASPFDFLKGKEN